MYYSAPKLSQFLMPKAVPDLDLEKRRAGGAVSKNKFVRPFRPPFALKIREAAPLGPSPKSATEKDKNGRETQITE